MLNALREAPDRPAIESGGRVVTRGELLEMVRRIAGGLAGMGVGAGTRVGMRLPLTPEAYAAHLAAHVLGAAVAAFRPVWAAQQEAAARAHVDVVVDDVGELLRAGPVDVTPRARAGDIARLIFTSGSTGRPKACAHTYQAFGLAFDPGEWPGPLARAMAHFGRYLVIQNLSGPPMFAYLGRTLVAGGTAVLIGDMGLPEAIERARCTAVVMHPARLVETLASGADLSSLRALVLGGSPASSGLIRAATARLGPIVWQVYGQSEAGAIAMLTPGDIAAGHGASVGRPLRSVELDVRDGGEIWVRSPHMMAGYLGEAEPVLRDGWLNTRDLGHIGADGMLHLTGRARDVILVNAEVCYAGAIERVLASHPGVAQAFVVGSPDPRTGEAIHAFIVPAGRDSPHPKELTALVGKYLSANSIPSSVTVIHDIPLTEAGKPDKRALLG